MKTSDTDTIDKDIEATTQSSPDTTSTSSQAAVLLMRTVEAHEHDGK